MTSTVFRVPRWHLPVRIHNFYSNTNITHKHYHPKMEPRYEVAVEEIEVGGRGRGNCGRGGVGKRGDLGSLLKRWNWSRNKPNGLNFVRRKKKTNITLHNHFCSRRSHWVCDSFTVNVAPRDHGWCSIDAPQTGVISLYVRILRS